LKDFHQFDWRHYWRSQIEWSNAKILERECPECLITPNGRQARIDYQPAFETEGRPILKAILQNLFGMVEIPILARGQVRPLLHILGPNRRPVQVTSDLAGFWSGSYQQVRRELKGRYPKHAWPENP